MLAAKIKKTFESIEDAHLPASTVFFGKHSGLELQNIIGSEGIHRPVAEYSHYLPQAIAVFLYRLRCEAEFYCGVLQKLWREIAHGGNVCGHVKGPFRSERVFLEKGQSKL